MKNLNETNSTEIKTVTDLQVNGGTIEQYYNLCKEYRMKAESFKNLGFIGKKMVGEIVDNTCKVKNADCPFNAYSFAMNVEGWYKELIKSAAIFG